MKQNFDAMAAESGELLIVDSSVSGSDILLTGLARPMEVILLEEGLDPLRQVALALSSRFGTQRLHILAQGEPGAVFLGGVRLDAAYLKASEHALNTIRFALGAEPAICLWASFAGVGEVGKAFLSQMAKSFQATVMSSRRPIEAGIGAESAKITEMSPFTNTASQAFAKAL